jgi:hypothetical protein
MILTAADPIEGFAPEAPACQGNSTQEQSIQGLLQGPFFHLTKEKWVQEEIVQADRIVPRTRGCAVTNVLIILDIATTSQHRPQFFTAFMRSGARI